MYVLRSVPHVPTALGSLDTILRTLISIQDLNLKGLGFCAKWNEQLLAAEQHKVARGNPQMRQKCKLSPLHCWRC